jgi:toxin CptA
MSIATSAEVRPSRFLCALTLAMTCVLWLTAWQLALISNPGTPDVVQALAMLVCVFAGCLLALSCRTRIKTLRIDITATGQIRLTHTSRDAFIRDRSHTVVSSEEGEVVQLLRDSTLWSCMLILRVRTGSGKIIVLPILRDSVTAAAFRSACVACQWIAAQNMRPASASFFGESLVD